MSQSTDAFKDHAFSRARKDVDFLPTLNDMLTVWDFVAGLVLGKLALLIYDHLVGGNTAEFASAGPFWREIILGSLIATLVLREPRLATDRHLRSLGSLVQATKGRCLAALALLLAVALATRAIDDMARLWVLFWSAMFAISVVASRYAFIRYVGQLVQRGELREAVAIVGLHGATARLAARIAADADVVAVFEGAGAEDAGTWAEDRLNGVLDLCRSGSIDSVIVALEKGQDDQIASIVEQLKAVPVQVAVCPDLGWHDPATPELRILGGLPMAVVADRPIARWNLLIKNLLDKLLATCLLVLVSPLLLIAAVAIVTTSPGPAIFRQCRQGWGGRDFIVYKFRTMRVACEPYSAGWSQTRRGDSRCTSVGRFLRRWSLDELPQLWNVVRGDMSLVGPRPHADKLHDAERVGCEIVAEYAQRNRVRPGITGWAQVNGLRGAATTTEQLRRRVEFDLFYIEHWSLLLDLQILLRTPWSVVFGENAF